MPMRSLVRDRRALTVELERCWEEQWRRAKEICDLLDECFGTAPLEPSRLRLVLTEGDPEPAGPTPSRKPRLRALDR
jgi:hypothetical protein